MKRFNQSSFISKHITKRDQSYFINDITANSDKLNAQINGKSVLVIGGAGTIGSSFIKAILKFNPGKLTVVDYSENGLTELTRDLRSDFNEYIPDEYITYPFDFGSEIFAKLFRTSSFDIVACFAAHKHVRSEKDHLAIEAMINNNVVNTYKLLELCRSNPPEHFFCVSTDKAANPVNVMGASKKLMENVLMSYTGLFKIATARFANVAFSNGSLLDGFNYRLAKGQPLSSPADVKRYFVSPEESGQLCMLACILGNSGEVFFPKLDESQMLTFSSIAEEYLKSQGYTPEYSASEKEARDLAAKWDVNDKNYPVYFFSSDTSGEKMYEEFFASSDKVEMERFEALGVIDNVSNHSIEDAQTLVRELTELFDSSELTKKDIVGFINLRLSDFNHIETGKSLDQKM